MLFLHESPLISNAVNSERDRFGTFRGRSRIAVNVRFTEFPVAVEIRANAVSGSYSLITEPFKRAANVNMSGSVCTVNIGDTAESDILSCTAYNFGRNFIAGLIVTDDIGGSSIDVLTDSGTTDIFIMS